MDDKFELPDDLSQVEDLAQLEADAVAALDAAVDGIEDPQHPSVAEADEIDRLSTAVREVRAKVAERAEESAANLARIKAAQESVAEADEPDDDGEPDDSSDTEPEADAEVEVEAEDKELVAASAEPKKSLARRAAAKAPKADPPAPARPRAALLAAADVPGYATGAPLDLTGAGHAALARMSGYPTPTSREELGQVRNPETGLYEGGRQVKGQVLRNGAVMIKREFEEALVASGNNDEAVLEYAAKESRLPGNSLLAAGGWCAVSETIYDLCDGLESSDGLIDLPEINLNRGGLRWTRGPQFQDLYCDQGFCFTEEEIINGAEKPCFEVPCTEFEEARLGACGLCITAPILTNRGYPELVRRYVSGGMNAHQHRMSAKVINDMVAAAGAPVAFPDSPGATGSVLNSLEIVTEQFRYRYRMSRGSTLEVVLPYWLRGVIRADLANRWGCDSLSVTDQQINSHLAQRGVRVQWVYDWQPFSVDCPPGEPFTLQTGWPDVVQVLIYPAGTFIKGVSDIISLDTIYDSTNLRQNMFTALFFEEGVAVIQRCYEAALLEIPLCADGTTGGPGTVNCWTQATPVS